MKANQEVDKTIALQASEWVTVLRRKASAEELAALAEWIKTSPRHIRDLLLMSTIEQELRRVSKELPYGIDELSTAATSNVVPLSISKPPLRPVLRRETARVRWGLTAAAAATVLALIGWWQAPLVTGWQSYSTTVGEQRAIELADGSIVHLNTRSQIKVRITAGARDIQLLAGEALFKAHGDPARPFRVHADDVAIQAIGTQFNVYRKPEGTTVTVIEGKVRISNEERSATVTAMALSAGESAQITAKGTLDKQPSADLSSATAWRQRRLVFQNASIVDMVQEFNRYNRAPQFRLEGNAVLSRHYTGVFDADDPESLTELLEAEPDLVVKRTANSITVGTK